MANKSTYLESKFLNRLLRRLTTTGTAAGSTTTPNVTSSTGFTVGDYVFTATDGTFHQITAIPNGTSITFTPASASPIVSGNVTAVGYQPITVYVGLFSAAPTDAGGGTEAVGGSYARVALPIADTTWNAPSGSPSATANTGVITFPTSTATWGGTMTHFGIFDAASGGNLLAWNILTQSQVVGNTGITPSFAAGALTWSED